MPREWLADQYQRKMYMFGSWLHGYRTGNWSTLNYHNWFTRRAERSIEKQMRRVSGRLFIHLQEEKQSEKSSGF